MKDELNTLPVLSQKYSFLSNLIVRMELSMQSLEVTTMGFFPVLSASAAIQYSRYVALVSTWMIQLLFFEPLLDSVCKGTPCDPDKRVVAPDMELLQKKVSPWLASRFEGRVKSEVPVMAEGCMYSMTPDEDFILDFLSLSSGKGQEGKNDSPQQDF